MMKRITLALMAATSICAIGAGATPASGHGIDWHVKRAVEPRAAAAHPRPQDCLAPQTAWRQCLYIREKGPPVELTSDMYEMWASGQRPCTDPVCPLFYVLTAPTLSGSAVYGVSRGTGVIAVYVGPAAGSQLTLGKTANGTIVLISPSYGRIACGNGSSYTLKALTVSQTGGTTVTRASGTFVCDFQTADGAAHDTGAFNLLYSA